MVLYLVQYIASHGNSLIPPVKEYNTIQYNTIQYNTTQYNTIQYNTIQYTFLENAGSLQAIEPHICDCYC